jgi:hypothetical protein
MKQRFSDYNRILLEAEQPYRITHLEELEIEDFVGYLNDLDQLHATQKLDGANLKCGFDSDGFFYTSREQKGGGRYYSEKNYPKRSTYDGFRAAHAALVKVVPQLSSCMSPGEAVNMEILYGAQPNTVYYGDDGICYIAFLEMIAGDDPSINPDQRKIKKLGDTLGGELRIDVKTLAYDTVDGIDMARQPKMTSWKFSTPTIIKPETIEKIDIHDELDDLKTFLKKSNAAAHKMGKELTNFEVMKDKSRDLSDERKALEEQVMKDYKMPIKEKFLKLVKKIHPVLKGEQPPPKEKGVFNGIEGLIFTDKKGQKFKVVDRDTFTRINKFNYQVRNAIGGKVQTSDPDASIESRGGLIGEARTRCVKLFGLENAEIPSQATRIIEKLRGETREGTIKNLIQTLNQANPQALRRKMQAVWISALDDLEEALDAFKIHSTDYKLELPGGEVIKYTQEVRRRTLLAFADARALCIMMIRDLRKVGDMAGLIEVFFNKQLDKINGKEEEPKK